MKKQKHPFPTPAPMYIEAHAGSSVVIGCSGETKIGSAATPADEMERELVALFRSLGLRDKVQVMRGLYDFAERRRLASGECLE